MVGCLYLGSIDRDEMELSGQLSHYGQVEDLEPLTLPSRSCPEPHEAIERNCLYFCAASDFITSASPDASPRSLSLTLPADIFGGSYKFMSPVARSSVPQASSPMATSFFRKLLLLFASFMLLRAHALSYSFPYGVQKIQGVNLGSGWCLRLALNPCDQPRQV